MFSQITDPYIRQARLAPALLVVLPFIVDSMIWFPGLQSALGVIYSIAVASGLTLLLAQLGRDAGKKKEPELFTSWRGKPSVALLRWSDSRIDPITKAAYRKILSTKISGLKFPTEAEERDDPTAADQVYEACTQWLLTKTRDTKKFNLLFKENMSYGFRRNLWGLKAVGLTISIAISIFSTAEIGFHFFKYAIEPAPVAIIVTALLWLTAIWWVFGVSRTWVKIPADAFGLQLLAACRSV